MNKIYRVVWNKETSTWTAVCEYAKSKGKSSSSSGVVGTLSNGVFTAVRFTYTALVSALILVSGQAMAATITDGAAAGAVVVHTGGSSTSVAQGKDSTAIGTNAKVIGEDGEGKPGQSSIAFGSNATVTNAKNAIAFGTGAKADFNNAIAVGNAAHAAKQSDLAIGDGAKASNAQDTAVGVNTVASGNGSSAFGYLTKATGYLSTAVGNQAQAKGGSSIAVGKSEATTENSIAVGNGAVANTRSGTIAIGADTTASGTSSVALGTSSKSTAQSTVAVGSSAKALKDNAVAIGDQAEATSSGTIALGQAAGRLKDTTLPNTPPKNRTGNNGVFIGVKAGDQSDNNENQVAIGHEAAMGSTGNHNVASGYKAGQYISGANNIAIGHAAGKGIAPTTGTDAQPAQIVNLNNTVAIGHQATTNTNNTVVIGNTAKVSGTTPIDTTSSVMSGISGIAIGNGSEVRNRNFGIAIGDGAFVGTYDQTKNTGTTQNPVIHYDSTRGDQSDNAGRPGVAIGWKTQSTGDDSIALGNDSISTGRSSVSLGKAAYAEDTDAIAIGNSARAGQAKASSPTNRHNSTAIGSYAQAIGGWNTALGTRAYTNNDRALAVGSLASAEGQNATAVGSYSFVEGDGGSALGYHAIVTKKAGSGTALGTGTVVDGRRSGGLSAAVNANPDAVVGVNRSYIGGEDNYAIGNKNVVGGKTKNSVALGNNIKLGATSATLNSTNPVGVGNSIAPREETVTYADEKALENAIAIGNESSVASHQGIAIGKGANVTEKGKEATWNAGTKTYDLTDVASTAAIAVGDGATAKGTGSVAVGHRSKTEFMNSTAVGNETKAVGYNSSAFGFEATAKGISSVAIGDKALAGIQDDGSHAPSTNRGVAIGTNTNATGETAVALGSNAESKAHRGTALGVLSKAAVNDGVALGAYSTANRNAGANGADPLSAKQAGVDASVWTATHAAVSVGNDAAITDDPRQGATATAGKFNIPKVTRQITNVAAGSQDTDAVNVAQLKAAGFVLATTADTQAGGTATDSTPTDATGAADKKIINGETLTLKAGKGVDLKQNGAEVTISTTLESADKTHYYSVKTTDTTATSNYNNDGAEGLDSLAAGVRTKAVKKNAVAIGSDTVAVGSESLAVGNNVIAGALLPKTNSSDPDKVDTSVDVVGATAVGNNSRATATGAQAFGQSSKAMAENAAAVGRLATASGARASAFGVGNTASGASSFAGGDKSVAAGANSIAVGLEAKSTHDNTIAIGKDAKAQIEDSIAIGRGVTTEILPADDALANNGIGNREGMIAIGSEMTKASGKAAISIGRNAQGIGRGTVALGDASQSLAGQGVAIGAQANVANAAAGGIAIGSLAKAEKHVAIAVGSEAQAKGDKSVAVGSKAIVDSAKGVAVGYGAKAEGAETANVAIGEGAYTNASGALAIGIGASAKGLDVVTTNNQGVPTNDKAKPYNAIAIGKGANVDTLAAGANGVQERSTDAIAIGTDAKANYASTIAIGYGAKANTKSSATAIGLNSDAQGWKSLAVGVGAVAKQTDSVALGSDSVADIGINQIGADPLNAQADKNGHAWKSTKAAVSVGNIAGGVTRQITSVAAGTQDTDAVNVAQLKAAGFKLTTSESDGVVVGSTEEKVKNGDTVTIDAGQNIKVTQTGSKVSIATKDDVEFNTATTKDNAGNQTLLNGTGLTITPTGGNNPVSLTSTGLNNGGNKIIGVADGNIAQDSKEAVNGGQLFTTNTKVDTNAANIAKGLNFAGNTGEFKRELGDKVTVSGGLTSGTASNTNIRTVANNGTIDIQIADAPVFTGKVSAQGLDAGGQKITNVAKGDAANDAVNVAQLEKAINDAKVQSLTKVESNSPFSYINSNGDLLKRDVDSNGLVKYYKVNGGDEYTPTSDNDITITALNPKKTQTSVSVKVGNISAGTDDKDAVNVSQLKDAVKALGGGAEIGADGSVTQPTYTVAGNTFNTVGGAIDKLDKEVVKPLTFVGDNAGEKVERKLGTELKVQGGADQAKLSENNIGVVGSTTDNSLTIKLAKDVNLGNDGSLTAGDSKVNNDGLTITKAGKQAVKLTSSGLDNGGNAISNVASNLPATAYNTAGANNPSNATTAQAAPTNADAIKNNAATVGDVLNAGWNVQTNGNATDFVKPYDTVNFADGTGTTVTSETDGDKTTFKVNVLTPVVYTDENGNKLYKQADGSFRTQPNGGGDLVDPPNVIASMHGPTGLTNQPVKLANVAAGVANTDAVNVSQLKPLATALGTTVDGDGTITAPSFVVTKTDGSKYDGVPTVQGALDHIGSEIQKGISFTGNSGTVTKKLGDTFAIKGALADTATASDKNIRTDVGTDGTMTIKLAESPKFGDVTVNADGNGKITGVADGDVSASSKDAVNGGQLHGVKSVADSAVQSIVIKAEGTDVKTLTKDDNALNIKGDDNVKVGKDGSDVKVSLKDVVTIGDTTTGKPVKIDGTTGTITGLTNKDLTANDFATVGRAASEEQLKIVDDFAVKYDKDPAGKPNKDSITLAGTPAPATAGNDGKLVMAGGTALNNVASAGDYTQPENAYKAVNAGDLNNAVVDVKNAGMNFGANDQSQSANKAIHRKLGDTVGIKGGITDTATATSGENVITRTTADGNINIELAKNAKFDSVVAGGTKISADGVSFVDNAGAAVADSPSITKTGINAGNKKITNVAKGTADTDAVNVSQLNEQLTATEKTTTATAGSDKLTVKGTTTGNNTDYVIDLAGSTKDSLAKADSAVQSIKVKANGADVTTLDKDNNTLDITQGDNITISNDGGKVKVGLNKDVTGLDSLTSKTITAGTGTSQVVLDDTGVKVGGNTYISGTGLNANNKAISNVASNLPATAYNTAGANNPSNATTAQAAPTNADAIKNNAATVGDVLNAGWNVQTNGNATDFVKPYDTVNFADGTGTTVTSETDGDKTTFKVNVNAQSLAETAQLPVVYTKANGDKVYKHADGKFYDKPAGQAGATEVPATDIIASMQNPDGTTTAPATLANIKAGIKDTDAVNVSQLKGVATSLGGGASVNPDGTFKAPSYTLTNGNPSDGGTTTYTNVGDALTGLNTAVNKPLTFAGDSGNNVERKLGSTLNIKGGATGTLTDGNIGVVADGTDTLTVKLAKDVNLGDDGSLTAGDSKVNNDGLTITKSGKQPVSLTSNGLNNGGNTITNVKAGTADTDVVNVSQLKEVQTTAKAAKTEVTAGDNMAVTSTVGTDGQTIYTVATKPDVSFDSVTVSTGTNQVVLDDAGVNVGGNTYISDAGLNANDKKVTNVAKGDVSANSKDAINGSQLYAHGEGVKNIIGGNTTYDPATGAYTNADIGGTGKGNIHDAIASINTTANAGWNVQTNAGNKTNVKPSDTVNFIDGSNIKITNDGTNITVATADDLTVNSVTAGNTVVNNDGVKVGDVQITAGGINAGNQQITNLKSGLNGKTLDDIKADASAPERSNAATIGDLATVQNNVTNITHNYNTVIGGSSADGKVLDSQGNVVTDNQGNSIDVADALKTYNVQDNKAKTDNTIITAIKNMNEGGIKFFHVNDGTGKQNIAGTDTHKEDSTASGKFAAAVGYEAQATGENALAFGKGSQALAKNAIAIGTGNIVTGENSGAIGDPSIINGANSYSVGNNNTITTDKTFVLGNEVKQTVADSVFLGDKSSSAGIHTTVNGGHYTYAGANDANVSGVAGSSAPVGVVSVGTEGGQTRQIQNVAAGVVSANSTDAINGSQLYYTNEAITNVANNTINMGNQLNNRINDVADDANAGVSSAMAMASLPQAYLPGKSMITGGVASYNGEGAVAVGLSKLSDNGRWVLKISGSADTQGNAGGSIGAGFHF